MRVQYGRDAAPPLPHNGNNPLALRVYVVRCRACRTATLIRSELWLGESQLLQETLETPTAEYGVSFAYPAI